MTERTAAIWLVVVALAWLAVVAFFATACGGGPRRCADTGPTAPDSPPCPRR